MLEAWSALQVELSEIRVSLPAASASRQYTWALRMEVGGFQESIGGALTIGRIQ